MSFLGETLGSLSCPLQFHHCQSDLHTRFRGNLTDFKLTGNYDAIYLSNLYRFSAYCLYSCRNGTGMLMGMYDFEKLAGAQLDGSHKSGDSACSLPISGEKVTQKPCN